MFERLERRLAALKQQIEASRKRGWWVTDIDGKMAVSPVRLEAQEAPPVTDAVPEAAPPAAETEAEVRPKKRKRLAKFKPASTDTLTYAELERVPSMEWFENLRNTQWNVWTPLPNGHPVGWQPPIVIVLLRDDTITMWVNKKYDSLVPEQFFGEYFTDPGLWQEGSSPKWRPGSRDIVGFKMITGVPLP